MKVFLNSLNFQEPFYSENDKLKLQTITLYETLYYAFGHRIDGTFGVV